MNELSNNNKSIVFIGDSITDCGRTYPTTSEFGYGFAFMCIEKIKAAYPGIPLYNRGISGNTISALHQRWQEDCLALNPKLVTLLIGVNDVNFSYRREGFLFNEALLKEQRTQMFESLKGIDAKLILIKPFAFEGELHQNTFAPRLHWLTQTMDDLARRYAQAYIAPGITPGDPTDGVHPSPKGHELIFSAWTQAVKEILPLS